MLTYNLSLIFDKDTEAQIRKYADEINSSLDAQFVLDKESKPHISVIKFNTAEELSSELIEKIEKLCHKELYVTFSGLTFIPSNDGGSWVEISVIKTNDLIELQKEAEFFLPNVDILNKIGDGYRPHVTLSKTVNSKDIRISNLNQDILRKKAIPVKVNLDLAGKNF